MSSNNDKHVVLQCFNQGASGFILKPIIMKDVQNIWTYLLKKNKRLEYLSRSSIHESENLPKSTQDAVVVSVSRNSNKRKEKEEKIDIIKSEKKKRIAWTPELHQSFLEALKTIGTNGT